MNKYLVACTILNADVVDQYAEAENARQGRRDAECQKHGRDQR